MTRFSHVLLLIAGVLRSASAFSVLPPSNKISGNAVTVSSSSSALSMGLFDDVSDKFQSFVKTFTMKANASHILLKGGEEAEQRLRDIKEEIGNDASKFSEYASMYSACPSSQKGGNLGEFGPKQMVKEFDTVVFNDDVGVVHGPVKTQFGYHLILINSRSE